MSVQSLAAAVLRKHVPTHVLVRRGKVDPLVGCGCGWFQDVPAGDMGPGTMRRIAEVKAEHQAKALWDADLIGECPRHGVPSEDYRQEQS